MLPNNDEVNKTGDEIKDIGLVSNPYEDKKKFGKMILEKYVDMFEKSTGNIINPDEEDAIEFLVNIKKSYVCYNCGVSMTPFWRKGDYLVNVLPAYGKAAKRGIVNERAREICCNACGLSYTNGKCYYRCTHCKQDTKKMIKGKIKVNEQEIGNFQKQKYCGHCGAKCCSVLKYSRRKKN